MPTKREPLTGSKNRYHEVLATTLAIASTGAMLIVGHEAPCRLAALARRTEIPDHTDKAENFREVYSTSDASETQWVLIGTWPDCSDCSLTEDLFWRSL